MIQFCPIPNAVRNTSISSFILGGTPDGSPFIEKKMLKLPFNKEG
jgi:hypothetical protein